jgi:hypothetical protein
LERAVAEKQRTAAQLRGYRESATKSISMLDATAEPNPVITSLSAD